MEFVGKMAKKQESLFIGIAALLFGVVLIFLVFSFYKNNVKYIRVKNANKIDTLYYIGATETATVKEVLIRVGNFVKKDQVILSLDSEHFENEVETLQDELKELEISLCEAKSGYHQALQVIGYQNSKNNYLKKIKEENVATYRKVHDNALKKYNAAKELYENGALSEDEFKTIEDEYENVKSQYVVSDLDKKLFEDFDIKAIKNGIIFSGDKILLDKKELESKIKSLEESIALQKEKIGRAMKDLENTTIKSPITGVVDSVLVNAGDVVQTGQKMMVIILPGSGWIEAYVNEKYISNIRSGAKVKIMFKAIPGEVFNGKVSYISKENQYEIRTSQNEMRVNDSSAGYESKNDKFIKVIIDFQNKKLSIPNGVSATVLIEKTQ